MLESTIEFKGYFWLPEDTGATLPGILKFSQQEGVVLELFGHFLELRNKRKANIILGFNSSGKKITLTDCFVFAMKNSVPGFETSDVSAINMFIGVHFNSIEEIEFSELCASYHNINHWLDISGFEKPIHSVENHDISITYKKPVDLVFNINEQWKIDIEFTYMAPLSYKPLERAEIKQDVDLVFKPNGKKSFEAFRETFMVFNSFLAVCYFSYPQIQSVTFYTRSDGDVKRIEWYYKHALDYTKFSKHDTGHDFLIVYNDINNKAESLIKEWYKLNSKAPATIDLLTDKLMKRGEVIEQGFLGMTQAIENLHRRIFNGNYSFVTRVQQTIDSVPPTIIQALLSGDLNFAERIKENRNFLTHYDEKLEAKAASLKELYLLTEKMKIILIAALLRNIGVTEFETEKIIIGKGVYLFNHLIDYSEVKPLIDSWK